MPQPASSTRPDTPASASVDAGMQRPVPPHAPFRSVHQVIFVRLHDEYLTCFATARQRGRENAHRFPRDAGGGTGRARHRPPPRARGPHRRAHLLPALLPVLLFVPFVLAPPLNHDVAAVLAFSERWLAGEHLYSDLIDVNPPLIYVLNLIPAAIAAGTGIDAVTALQACLVAFGLFVWWLGVRVRDRASEGRVECAFLDVLPGLFVFAAGYDFGQREYLMAVGALPYLLAAARRERGERPSLSVAVAMLAAVGFALKPHFLGIPALVELYIIARPLAPWPKAFGKYLRDPEPWAMAAVWAIYLLSLPLLFPDYLKVVVPLVLGYYLDTGDETVWLVLLVRRMLTVLLLLAPLAAIALWPGQRLARAAAAAVPGGAGRGRLGDGAAQGLVLPHRPDRAFFTRPRRRAGGALARCAGRGARAGRSPSASPAGLGGLFALYAICVGEAPWNELNYATSEAGELTALLQQEAEGERVLVFSPGIAPVFPALNYAHAHLTLRTMNLWLLDGAYRTCLPDGHRYREVWEMGRPEFFLYHTVAEDFARNPPAAVVLDRFSGIPGCAEPFDVITYFSRHPLFAEVWSHYRLTGRAGGFSVYTRKD